MSLLNKSLPSSLLTSLMCKICQPVLTNKNFTFNPLMPGGNKKSYLLNKSAAFSYFYLSVVTDPTLKKDSINQKMSHFALHYPKYTIAQTYSKYIKKYPGQCNPVI